MNSTQNVLKVYRLAENGSVLSATEYENDIFSQHLMVKIPTVDKNLCFSMPYDESKLNLKYSNFMCDDIHDRFHINFYKLEDDCMNFGYNEICNVDQKPIFGKAKKDHNNILNVPTMIRCQNCETNFPTKYQYQRHQCEFNADKVVLKPDAEISDVEKGMRIKYDCPSCSKQFVSKNNLERHRASHENTKDNICEHCNKQFVSENRLRIHKENHCKKAGDISKFYRSDVAVWKCCKCHEVFSSLLTANFHTENCTEIINIETCGTKNLLAFSSFTVDKDDNSNHNKSENRNIDKIMTEILLQCEFCNRTYADKNLLLLHQKTHTTERNYECVNCNEAFDSYATAAQHWLKKCSERANLFYLPKLTYCEYCDRTFKSHEILYTHKIKKKHYTAKIYCRKALQDVSNFNKGEQYAAKLKDNKDVIEKLIEDVLITLDVPVNKMVSKQLYSVTGEEGTSMMNNNEQSQSKDDNEYCSKEDLLQQGQEPEKRKRGRKRKWSKQFYKGKKSSSSIEDGYIYQCERCIKVFVSILDLECHREKEHAANFNCEECGQILHSAKALLIHSRAHKSLKPYVCDTCGRSYSQTSHLWQHMRFHQGIKPFACPHEGCEARYTIRPDLKDHIRKVHTRERPFKCTVCNKCFLTGSVYYQHRLIHTNDRRYGCDVCCKRFFRADALNNHKRIHTDERPYPCSVCGREFRQKGDRNKHVRTQHPDAIVN